MSSKHPAEHIHLGMGRLKQSELTKQKIIITTTSHQANPESDDDVRSYSSPISCPGAVVVRLLSAIVLMTSVATAFCLP